MIDPSVSQLSPSRRSILALLAGGVAAGCSSTDVLAGPAAVEPVSFTSKDAALAGDIYLPAGPAIAGIVLVHGSGPTPRMTAIAQRFAANGYAVLTYDKRGVGASGGTYENLYNISWDNLHLLASDAAAAMDKLAAHPRLRGRRIGMFGISQAGWIIPIAAQQNSKVAFMALWSGPVCRVSDELEDSITSAQVIAAEGAARAKEGGPTVSADLIRGYVAKIRADGTDVDSRVQLRRLKVPGLWLFGGKDNQLPTALCMRELDAIIASGRSNYARSFLPDAGHGMLGVEDEAYRQTLAWLKAHAA